MGERVTSQPLVVLKLGSSVLTDPNRIRDAGREVRRLAGDRHVLAVVSALPGRTDELMGMARQVADAEYPDLLAGLLSTGEDASVALLAMAVRRVGGRVRALSSAELQIRTTGPVMDAEPIDLDSAGLRHAFDAAPAVVVPGFVGRDASGAVTVLGRGGSDLTALFLATRLAAQECRLVKDVDGLYTDDPRVSPSAGRYATATWSRALAVGNQVVQPKAVRFAERHGAEFVLGALGAENGTRVGHGPDVLAAGEYLAESVPG